MIIFNISTYKIINSFSDNLRFVRTKKAATLTLKNFKIIKTQPTASAETLVLIE